MSCPQFPPIATGFWVFLRHGKLLLGMQKAYRDVKEEHASKQAELKGLEQEVKCNEGPKKQLELAIAEIAKQVIPHASA